MNGKIFPSEYDHHHSIGDRSVIVLNSTPQRFNSSQNAAMVQYKISPQSTFAIRVTHLRNPERKQNKSRHVRITQMSFRIAHIFMFVASSAVGRESRDGKFPGIPGLLAFPFPGNSGPGSREKEPYE